MQGHESIIQYRTKFRKKPSSIFIEFGLASSAKSKSSLEDEERFLQTGQYATVIVDEPENFRTLDFRFVVGCQVHLHGKEMSNDLIEFAERLVQCKAEKIICAALDRAEFVIYENGEWGAY